MTPHLFPEYEPTGDPHLDWLHDIENRLQRVSHLIDQMYPIVFERRMAPETELQLEALVLERAVCRSLDAVQAAIAREFRARKASGG
jgi:hypothetical protein